MATQGAPKWSQGCPRDLKGTQSRPKGRGEKVVERHPKESKKSQTNKIHINEIYASARSTAIQRPASINIENAHATLPHLVVF